ncbi:MAG: DUF4279 domain-containing protein [Candidatus Sericytochromatia bacterium]
MIETYLNLGFSFSSKEILSAEAITEILKIQPISTKNPGDPMGVRKGGVKFGHWEYSTKSVILSLDNAIEEELSPHFQHLKKMFGPRKSALQAIKNLMPAELTLTVKWKTDQVNQEHGPTLTKDDLEICKELQIDGIRFSIDISEKNDNSAPQEHIYKDILITYLNLNMEFSSSKILNPDKITGLLQMAPTMKTYEDKLQLFEWGYSTENKISLQESAFPGDFNADLQHLISIFEQHQQTIIDIKELVEAKLGLRVHWASDSVHCYHGPLIDFPLFWVCERWGIDEIKFCLNIIEHPIEMD